MTALHVIIMGEAKPKLRPKFSTFNGHARAITPKKTRENEGYIRHRVASAMAEQGETRIDDGPLRLRVVVYRAIPKSLSKRAHAAALAGESRPTTKPDIDNLVKSIKDAMNGVAWRDDAQVVELLAIKAYDDGGGERTEIKLWKWEGGAE